MANLKLRYAGASYDRMMALRTGDVKPEGIDLEYVAIEHVREIFDRMGWNAEFDLAEFSSTEYISRVGRGDKTFIALPVFPSRVFRHSFVFVNCNRIAEPKDLEGKRIGTALYTQTAALVDPRYPVEQLRRRPVWRDVGAGGRRCAGLARQAERAAAAAATQYRGRRGPLARRPAQRRRDRRR